MPTVFVSGLEITLDEEDLGLLSEPGWRVMNVNGLPYVFRNVSKRRGTPNQLFHRAIMNCPEGMLIDHKNGLTLDCRKENLRICTHAQNMRNRKMSKANRCGFKGVHEDCRTPGVFIAQIKFEGKRYRLGRFKDPAEAHAAYCVAATKYHGEFARTA
jgi:hypothetical protein